MTNLKSSTFKSIKVLYFPNNIDERGELVVMENDFVPFNISRVFTVSSVKRGSIRGKHAHKKCTQLMVCISGSVDVICRDVKNQIKYRLDKPNMGLLVPPGIFAEQKYNNDTSTLMVMCDMPYDPEDYIHNIEDLID